MSTITTNTIVTLAWLLRSSPGAGVRELPPRRLSREGRVEESFRDRAAAAAFLLIGVLNPAGGTPAEATAAAAVAVVSLINVTETG